IYIEFRRLWKCRVVLYWEVPAIPSFAGDTLLEEQPFMFAIAHFRQCRRSGSVLLPALFVVLLITLLLSAILPLTLSGYGLARADRDRAGALAAAEGGLNWEIGRIDNRLWNKTDSGATGPVDGSGNPTTMDNWPTSTGA